MSFTRKYADGELLNLTVPNSDPANYQFAAWYKDGVVASTSKTLITPVTGNNALRATYVPILPLNCGLGINPAVITAEGDYIVVSHDGGASLCGVKFGVHVSNNLSNLECDIHATHNVTFGSTGFGLVAYDLAAPGAIKCAAETGFCNISVAVWHWFYQWGSGSGGTYGPSIQECGGSTQWQSGAPYAVVGASTADLIQLKLVLVSGTVKYYAQGNLIYTSLTSASGQDLALAVTVDSNDTVKIHKAFFGL